MKRTIVQTNPIDGQKPGTSGLRKKTHIFRGAHFLENYVQSIFDGIGGIVGKTLVVGGDGRFYNDRAIQTILRMAAANGAAKCIVGQGGLLSTPAASYIIRHYETDGGLILSASHNPGGPDADFGLKYNMPNGGPATEGVTDLIFECTQEIHKYFTVESADYNLKTLGDGMIHDMVVTVIDPIVDYANLMRELFDFAAISELFAGGFRMCFDAMHAVTGPYAHAILETQLGAPHGTVINGTPSPNFGGGHPDPNPTWARQLMGIMMGDDAPDFGAASAGDGDRNMIVGRGVYVTPSDSLAVLAANAHLAPAYASGLAGVARSMPTSRAVDRVATQMGLDCFETPTGWKFFGNLLDSGNVTLCGEESAGTGSDHVREKDGLWAVLLWLNILAVTKQSVPEILTRHWNTYGRNYYSRHDYEDVKTEDADLLIAELRDRMDELVGQSFNGFNVVSADEFSYLDPVDNSLSKNQGVRINFEGGARVVVRLSGTGTIGATIRIYLERVETDKSQLQQNAQDALAPLIDAAEQIICINRYTGRACPDVIT